MTDNEPAGNREGIAGRLLARYRALRRGPRHRFCRGFNRWFADVAKASDWTTGRLRDGGSWFLFDDLSVLVCDAGFKEVTARPGPDPENTSTMSRAARRTVAELLRGDRDALTELTAEERAGLSDRELVECGYPARSVQ